MPTLKIVLKAPPSHKERSDDAMIAPMPTIMEPPIITPPAPAKKPQKTCATCAKKLTLTDFACGKCQVRFCACHRLPEEHACSHMENFRREAQAALAAANPQVVGKKVEII